ncbi:MAG: hypothetical protein ACRCV9_03620 [Burkholderiaceae bacterium]
MACKDCTTPGFYDLTCLACCVRLVESTRPSKVRASAMLHLISITPEAPKREEILERLNADARV